jgi:hypothetical protein
MLHRMAALEQRQRDAEAANANARRAIASGASAQYSHIPLWDRDFEAKMDAVTYVHFEEHQLPATAEGAKCLDATCSRIPPKGAKFCQCGAPTSILDLKCQHPACGHPCHGSVSEMLNQDICYLCREPLLYKLPAHLRSETAQKYSKLASTVGYKKTPPPDLSCIPKEFWITENENRVIMGHRRSSKTEVLADGASSSYEALSELKMTTTSFSQGEIMGDDMDFTFTAKAFVAAFKGMSFGRGMMATLLDLPPIAGVNSYTVFVSWTEAAIKGEAVDFNWDVPDGPSILRRYLEFMSSVVAKIAGSTLRHDHDIACTQINTAVKAAGSRNVNWTAKMGFEKYCAAFGDYHCKCIAWVSGSSFFAKLYCEDLLWNHIGTDGQMPMFVLRFFKNGVGTWISLFEKQYDRPQRLALDVAALGLVESNNGGPGLAALPAGKMGEQPAVGSASVLSSTEPNRTQFRAHNGTNNELAATHSFNWPATDGSWRSVTLNICWKCLNTGHTTSSCTNAASPYSMASTDHQTNKTQYIIDIAVFKRVLAKHLLLPAQWPGAYKTMAKAITQYRSTNQSNSKLPVSGSMQGKPTAEAEKLEAVRQGEAIPRKDIAQLELADLKATARVSAQRPTPPEFEHDYHQYPVIGVRDLALDLPGILPGTEIGFTGKMLDRDENLLTERGEVSKRCLMVQLCDQKKAESKHTFKVCREQSLTFIDRSSRIKDAYRHLNHVTNVDRHVNVSIRSHSDITSRNQALSPYFLKDSWLDEFGDGPVAVWTITGDDIELVVFILAAD